MSTVIKPNKVSLINQAGGLYVRILNFSTLISFLVVTSNLANTSQFPKFCFQLMHFDFMPERKFARSLYFFLVNLFGFFN